MMLMLSEVDDDAPKVDVDERERESVMARDFYLKNPTPPGAAQAT